MSAFNNPRNRLALTYLAIIMVLSVGFSVLFYRESTHAAGSGFRRQATQLRNNLYFTRPGALEHIRDDGISQFNDNLLVRLTILNMLMLVLGGFLSSYLARRSLEPLEQAIEAQSRFTSDAAHELRTPLTAMKTEIEVGLRSKKLPSDDAKIILQSNLEEIAKLEALTEALLRLAKNGHQPDPSSWKPVKITEILKAATLRVRPEADKRNITFTLPPDSRSTLRADHDQLIELFVILFDNAIRYGSDSTAVTVTAMQSNESLVVTVADKGIGIAKKDLPHIFERFYRADHSRTKASASGYGLGLSVAQAIVKSHNGTISTHSVSGNGTTFNVSLPL
ncbi:HAMP domain-containing sensor histidine kinase [soil metagenome]